MLVWRPTDDLLADLLTKPLMGEKFALHDERLEWSGHGGKVEIVPALFAPLDLELIALVILFGNLS